MNYKIEDDIELKYNTKLFPFEYKLLEWRLNINRQLYEEDSIDLDIYSEMENYIISRMNKIKSNK